MTLITGSTRWRLLKLAALHELGHVLASGTAIRLDVRADGSGQTIYDDDPADYAVAISRLYGGRLAEEVVGIFIDDDRDADDQRRIDGIARIAGFSPAFLSTIRRMTEKSLAPYAEALEVFAEKLADNGAATYKVVWRDSHNFALHRVEMH